MAEQRSANQVVKLDITWMSILRIVIVILSLVFIYLVRDIIALLFVVFIIVAALNPAVSRLQISMPRVLSVSVIYLILIALLSLVSILVFQPLARQLNELANTLPKTFSGYVPNLEVFQNQEGDFPGLLQEYLQTFSGKLSQLTGNIFQTLAGVFGGVVTAFTVLVMSFYLLLEEKSAKKALETILPTDQHQRAYAILQKFSDKLGSWFRGQLLLMLIIGIIDYIILLILGVEGALALATWGGVTELIPYVGPIIGAIPAIIVAWTTHGFWAAVLVAALMLVLVQWLESQFIVPNVMKKAVGLSPVIIIIALLIGGKLMGILGIILAVPVAAMISVIVHEWDNIIKIYNNRN